MTHAAPTELILTIPVYFRLATVDDLPKLEWHGEYTHFRRVFARAFSEQQAGRRLLILADVNHWPVGQVFVQLANAEDMLLSTRKRAYLYSLRVMDAFRNMGIGTALLLEAERLLQERSYASVSIAAAKDNPGARRLYERLNYKVFAEDAGRWSYVDHEGLTQHVSEPCWLLEKMLR